MDQDDIRLEFVSFIMAYPPLPRFPTGSPAEFFAKVQANHDFEAFEQPSDVSATLSTEARRRLDITRNELTFEATVSDHIDMLRRDVTSLMEEVLRHFQIRTFILPGVTMRAIWQAPPESNDVGDSLQGKVSISDETKALLGEVTGLSMTFAGHTDLDAPLHRHWNVEIAPYLRDRNRRSIWIELSTQFMEAYNEAISVDKCLAICYTFLRENVVPFLNRVFEEAEGR